MHVHNRAFPHGHSSSPCTTLDPSVMSVCACTVALEGLLSIATELQQPGAWAAAITEQL